MSEVPIARPIRENEAIVLETFMTCRRCGDLFMVSNHKNMSVASKFRCTKCLSTITLMKDLICVIN